MNNKTVQTLSYLVPFLYGLIYIFAFGTNLIIGDDWVFLDEWFKYKESGDLWTSLSSPLFGHIEIIPKAIQYAILPLCHWNTKVIMYVMQLFVFLEYVFVFNRAKEIMTREREQSGSMFPSSFILCVSLLAVSCYSAVNWENFSWAVNIGIVMCMAFSIGSFYFFNKYTYDKKTAYLGLSGIFMLVANLCHGSGLAMSVVYIGMGIVEYFTDRAHKNEKDYKSYSVAFIATAICMYLYIYIGTFGQSRNVSSNIWYLFSYYFVISGDIFAPGYGFMVPYMYIYAGILGFIFNALSLTVLFILIRNNLVRKYRFELLLMAYSVALRLMVLVQRSELGIISAMYSHYAIYTVLNILSLILIMYGSGTSLRLRNRRENELSAQKHILNNWITGCYRLIIFAFVLYSIACLYVSYGSMRERREKVNILMNFETEEYFDYEFLGMWLDNDDAIKQMSRAKQYGFSAFYDGK